MRALILISWITLAAARPEAGYSYNAPIAHDGHNVISNDGLHGRILTGNIEGGHSEGLISGQSIGIGHGHGAGLVSGPGADFVGSSGSIGVDISQGHGAGLLSSHGSNFGGSAGGIAVGIGHGHSSGLVSGHVVNSGVSTGIIGHGHNNIGLVSGPGSDFSASTGGIAIGGGGGVGNSYSTGHLISGGQSSVHKHIYVHVPPSEPEEQRHHHPIHVQPPQKHYKIIFIKAPSPPQYQAPIIPIQPQNEEKTLIYVLSKKPDEQPDVIVPAVPPTPPSKPEVYFIKYKTAKEHSTGHHHVHETGGQQIEGGTGVGLDVRGGEISGSVDSSHLVAPAVNVPSTNYGPPGHSGPY